MPAKVSQLVKAVSSEDTKLKKYIEDAEKYLVILYNQAKASRSEDGAIDVITDILISSIPEKPLKFLPDVLFKKIK